MKQVIAVFLLLTAGCSTLAPIAGGAAGGALGSLAGPAAAAAGGGLGVVAAQMAFPDEDVDTNVALAAAQAGVPAPGTAASTIHETTSLLHELGWWYLCLFILIPLITKKGRTWIRKFTDIHNSVSQREIDARDAHQEERIKKLEEMIPEK